MSQRNQHRKTIGRRRKTQPRILRQGNPQSTFQQDLKLPNNQQKRHQSKAGSQRLTRRLCH